MDAELSRYFTARQRESVLAEIGAARTLPNSTYVSEEFYRLEVARLYHNHWVAIGFADQARNPGDLAPLELCGAPLLLVRDQHDACRVFHNVCPYDGCLAVIEPQFGRSEIVTPYHGWTYALDGELLAAPFWSGDPRTDPSALEGRDVDLCEVASAVWCGMVFVNLAPGPTPFADFIAPLEGALSNVDLGGLSFAKDSAGDAILVRGEIATNWKTYCENACINVLHENFVHALYAASPELPRVAAGRRKTFTEIVDRGLLAFSFNEADFRETYGSTEGAPHIGKGLAPERGMFGTLFPNLYVSMSPIFIELCFALPLGPDRVMDVRAYLMASELADAEAFASVRQDIVSGFIEAGLEDNRITGGDPARAAIARV